MEEIINSIMQTPDNTNPNVLRSQLQGMASSSTDGVLVLHAHETDSGTVLDKTWKEIHDAPFAILRREKSTGFDIIPITSVVSDPNDAFYVWFSENVYETDSENGYPANRGK